jgi:hypothetical protein
MTWPPAVRELIARAMDDGFARAADAVPWGHAASVDAEAASVAVHPHAWRS